MCQKTILGLAFVFVVSAGWTTVACDSEDDDLDSETASDTDSDTDTESDSDSDSDESDCGDGEVTGNEVCDGDVTDCFFASYEYEPGDEAVCESDCLGYDMSACVPIDNIELTGMAELIQVGAGITGAAHMNVMRLDLIGMYESQVKLVIDQTFDELGADSNDAFSHIVASGPNALILHYSGGSRQIEDGDLLLMDLGARYQEYCSDISRTIPANGLFTERQEEIYQLVLDAQEAAAAAMVPGIHSVSDMTGWVLDYFEASPLRADDPYGVEQTMDHFFIHSVGHYIGTDVHGADLPYSTSDPVEVGHVITLEPGLYIESEGIGVRIEDDFFMTEDGMVNIHVNTIKTVDDIEWFMAEAKAAGHLAPTLLAVDPAKTPQETYNDHMDF